ncbi:hypothetical protein C8J56DRAFT_1058603 [Mycena floridula]|nr:hypothetical protein C8J56DRAFT_1058603 [Mycena floridula]
MDASPPPRSPSRERHSPRNSHRDPGSRAHKTHSLSRSRSPGNRGRDAIEFQSCSPHHCSSTKRGRRSTSRTEDFRNSYASARRENEERTYNRDVSHSRSHYDHKRSSSRSPKRSSKADAFGRFRSPSPMEFRPENLELNEKYIHVLFQFKKSQMELEFSESRNRSITSQRDELSLQNDQLRDQITKLTAGVFTSSPSNSSSSSSATGSSPAPDRLIRNLPRMRPSAGTNLTSSSPNTMNGLARRISAPPLAVRMLNANHAVIPDNRYLPNESPLSPGYVPLIDAHDVDRMITNSRYMNEAGRYANRTLNMFMVDAKATAADERTPAMIRVVERDFSTAEWYRPGYHGINSDAAEKARLRSVAKKIAACPFEVDWLVHSAAKAAEILLFAAPSRFQILGVPIVRDNNIRLTKISLAATRGARIASLTCPEEPGLRNRYIVAFAELTSHSGFYAQYLTTNNVTLAPMVEPYNRYTPMAESSPISAFDVAGHLSGLGFPVDVIDNCFTFGQNIIVSQIGGDERRLNNFGLEFWQPLLTESVNSMVDKQRPPILAGPEFLFVGERTFVAIHRRAFPTGVKSKPRVRQYRKPPVASESNESSEMVIDSETRNLLDVTIAENAFQNSGFQEQFFKFDDFASLDNGSSLGDNSDGWGSMSY